jgi:hypothetical protein
VYIYLELNPQVPSCRIRKRALAAPKTAHNPESAPFGCLFPSSARHEDLQRSLQHHLVPFEALYPPTDRPCRCLPPWKAYQRDSRTAPQAVVEESGSTAVAEAGWKVLWLAACTEYLGELLVLGRLTTGS